MEWISAKDRLPEKDSIIVALLNGREELKNIRDFKIRILRSWYENECRSLDMAQAYYLPTPNYNGPYDIDIVMYWMPIEQFPFPNQKDERY